MSHKGWFFSLVSVVIRMENLRDRGDDSKKNKLLSNQEPKDFIPLEVISCL